MYVPIDFIKIYVFKYAFLIKDQFLKIRKYTKKQIFEATQNYIDRKAKENYSYMMKAEYFIEKDGVSTLATEIDNLGEEDMDDNWTRNVV